MALVRDPVVLDDFNRAALGANYQQLSPDNGGAVAINSNIRAEGQTSTSDLNAAVRWVGEGTIAPNQYSKVALVNLGYYGDGYWSGPLIRASSGIDAARSYYLAFVEHNSGGPTWTTRVAKIVNGTYTVLATVSQEWAPSDTLAIEAIDNPETEDTTLRVYRNDVIISGLTVNDASLAGGSIGFLASQATYLDNLEGGNIVDDSGGGSAPTITDAGDESFYDGETGVVFTGTNFGATQGAGTLILSPTDDVEDVDAVVQTVTAWSDTSITATIVRGTLDLDATLYAFVINDNAESNAAGYEVVIGARAYVREVLIDLDDQIVVNETGITMFVYRSAPSSPGTPDQVLTVSTNGDGEIDQAIARGALEVDDPVWIALSKDDVTTPQGTFVKVAPVYE